MKKTGKWLLRLIILLICVIIGLFIGFAIGGKPREMPPILEEDRIQESQEIPTPEEESQEETSQEEVQEDPGTIQAREVLATMTPEEKIAQLFFVTPESLTGFDPVVRAGEATKKALEEYPVGGLIYFSKNIQSKDQLEKMLKTTREYSTLPLFFGVDEEGGQVSRLGSRGDMGVTKYPPMADIGASKDPEEAYEVGSTLGKELSSLGFNVDFAPVADVVTNPANTVIGNRAFSTDSSLVSSMVAKEVIGLEEQGVSAVCKHFPGHGSTAEDTHSGAAISNRTIEELRQTELMTFYAGMQAGTDFIMVGHMTMEAIAPGTPASCSSDVVNNLLRYEMGYEGIIITDAMNMKAITENYDSGEAAVNALCAGCDMILMPEDLPKAIQGVKDALADGILTQEQIDASVLRILKVKYQS